MAAKKQPAKKAKRKATKETVMAVTVMGRVYPASMFMPEKNDRLFVFREVLPRTRTRKGER